MTAFATPAPTGSKRHLIFSTANVNEKKYSMDNKMHHQGEEENLPNYKTILGENDIRQ